MRFGNYLQKYAVSGGRTDDCIDPLPQDHRFTDEAWRKFPFNFIYQGFLLQQQWWHNATTGLRGVSKSHEDMVEFASRQILDMVAPSNFPLTNPEILLRTVATGGLNLVKGFQNYMEDGERAIAGKRPIGADAFVVGRDVAKTPGKVDLSQSIDRAHSIRAGGRHGPAGADPHRSGLDHEILHPRSVAA